MRAFAAVFAREIAERRMVFLVGLTCGLLSLVAAAAHGWNAPGNAEVRLLAGSVGGLTLASALALLYGASTIAGETAEKRISFYFARPIPSGALWGAKLLAAIFVSFATGFLVYLPAWLAGPAKPGGAWSVDLTPGFSMLLGLAAVVACVLVAHALVTVARLRSPWVALDLILAPTLVILAAVFLRTFLRIPVALDYGTHNVAGAAMESLAGAVLFALFFSSFVQIAAGRTDARRAHGAFSVTFFGILGAAVTLLGCYSWWCTSAGAHDVQKVVGGVQAAPQGPWVYAGGPTGAWRGGSAFLLDTTTGRSLQPRNSTVVFSQDGSRAAWGNQTFDLFERTGRVEVHVADLATGRAVATGLETRGWRALALSPNGRRLAIRDGESLAAYDVSDPANPRQLAAFSVPEGSRGFAFVDEDTIRLFPRFYNPRNRVDITPPALEVVEFALPSKKSLVNGRFDRESLPYLRLSADGRYLVGTRRPGDDAGSAQILTLHDGRTGALVATLAADLRIPQARFLTGNRIAVAGIAGARARLDFFEGEKAWMAPARSIALGPAVRVELGGEVAPGRVAVALLPFEGNLPASHRAAQLVLVDAASGEVAPVAAGLVPANRLGWWTDPVLPPAEAGAPWTSLFLDADGRLVRFDPATGARTVLLGKGK